MMYYDYGNLKLDDISLYREVQEEKVLIIGEYRFSDMLDGFNSYLEKDELPTNRADLLDSIKGLEKLSKEDQNKNLFKEFIVTYHAFVEKTSSLVPFGDFAEAFDLAEELKSEPFGKNIVMCFNKSISITGFGAAVGKLTDFKLVSGFEEVRQLMGVENRRRSPCGDPELTQHIK